MDLAKSVVFQLGKRYFQKKWGTKITKNSKAYGILLGTIGWHKLHCLRFLPEGNQKMDRKSQTNCEMAENSGNPRPLKRQHYCLHTELRG